MLKFLRLGAATVAAVLSTQFTNSLLAAQANTANQSVQASTSNITDETLNDQTEFTNATSILVADSPTNTPEQADKAGQTGIILGLAAVAGGAAGVFLSTRKANNPFQLGSRPSQGNENTIRLDQASRGLQKKLLTLLHDDGDTANRLLSQVKLKNPHKSTDWYVEKVIYDLERDRGA